MNTSTIAKQNFESSGNKEIHYKKIINALVELKEGCSRAISKQSGLTQHQVSRRTLELINLNKIQIDRIGKSKYFNQKVNIYKILEIYENNH